MSSSRFHFIFSVGVQSPTENVETLYDKMLCNLFFIFKKFSRKGLPKRWGTSLFSYKKYGNNRWHNWVSGMFLILFFLIYPVLFSATRYFSLNIVKYCFFLGGTAVLLLAFLFLWAKGKLKKVSFFPFSITDIAMVAFAGISLISGFFSGYFPETVIGTNGRFNGMLTAVSYLILYFILSRCLSISFYKVIFICFAVSSCLVFLLGILNYWGLDPLRFYVGVRQDQKALFISTIGNRNFFSSFVCVTLPIFMALLIRTKQIGLCIFYSVTVALGVGALCVANSDSGFVGIMAILAVLFFFSLRDYLCSKRFVLLVTIFSGAAYFLGLFSQLADTIRWETSSVLLSFAYSNASSLCFASGLLLFLLLELLSGKLQMCVMPAKTLRVIWIALCGVFAATILVMLIYFSFINPTADIGQLTNYLRFSDSWGSNRGQVWTYLVSAFTMLSPICILIGTGPDTVYQVLHSFFGPQMESGQLLQFDSAHNEYLQYGITVGILGGLSYLVFVCSGIFRVLLQGDKSPYLLAIGSACLCYAVQGFFNISMISTTPFFFLLMAMGEAALRTKKAKISRDKVFLK